jgi:hypothetical protein
VLTSFVAKKLAKREIRYSGMMAISAASTRVATR